MGRLTSAMYEAAKPPGILDEFRNFLPLPVYKLDVEQARENSK